MFISSFYYILYDDFISNIYIGDDGLIHKVQGGADTVLNFSKNTNIEIQLEINSSIDTRKSTGTYCNSTSIATIKIIDGIPSINYSGGGSAGAWLNNAYWYGNTNKIIIKSYKAI